MKQFLVILMSIMTIHAIAQEKGQMHYLYSADEIPGSTKKQTELEEKDKPKLFAYTDVDKDAKDIVFLVIPGGGYGRVAINHEGHDVAKRLESLGYAAYVLDYRLPKKETMIDKRFGPLQDAQQAMLLIRKQFPKKRLAVIGFSAGGHLAATLSNFSKRSTIKGAKASDLQPDISVLCYPVISMEDGITHQGSKQNLIGPDATSVDTDLFSMEKQVSKKTPPTFLMSAKDDKTVPIENTYRYKASLDKFKIPNELLTYELGGHGFGLKNKTSDVDWFAAMIKWLETLK
ncbi:alpha/beta hydrolase [Sphingobacterium kyonggiense]